MGYLGSWKTIYLLTYLLVKKQSSTKMFSKSDKRGNAPTEQASLRGRQPRARLLRFGIAMCFGTRPI